MGTTEEGKILVRRALPSEVDSFIEWGLKEGWNMPRDPPTYFQSYPEGWLIAETKEGNPVGKLYCTLYPSGVGHIGFVIVDPEHRGKGVGTLLLEQAMEDTLSPAKQIALYSGPEEIPFYSKLGFQVRDKVYRMTLTLTESLINEKILGLGKESSDDFKIFQLRDRPELVEMVSQYDALYTGSYRPNFWKQGEGFQCLVALSKYDSKIVGVSASKPQERSTKIGPIYAEKSSIAMSILKRLGENFKSSTTLSVDVFAENLEAMKLFSSLEFKPFYDSFLLIQSKPAESEPHPSSVHFRRIFAIASLDFN